MRVSWFLVMAISVSPGLAVYHSKRKTFKTPKINDDALFGFSVSSMATGKKSKLIVGVPKMDNIGRVYACDPTTQDCSPVSIEGIKPFEVDTRYNNQSYWLGATVLGTEDFFVACAPRFIATTSLIDRDDVGIFGRCYSYKDSSATPSLLGTVPENMLESKYPFETTMDTFGWSIYIDSDDSIYIGGPGMGSGRVIRIRSNEVDSTGYAYGNYSNFNASYNFGYSITTGEFKPQGKNLEIRSQVAVGSTYGTDGRGKVIFRPLTDISLNSTNELVGPTVGSMFGAALCTASFNENGKKSALLVGAPAFADYDGYNTGAVYVYTAAKKAKRGDQTEGFLPNPITMFAGEAPNSFFGSAIINIGDLNGDQKDEIAIAAPYFKDTGCVYIYSGAHLAIDGNKPDPLQKILPSSPGIRTFGYSLGLLKDYDENGCDELAIGAPQSNEVTVLNCIAVITVKLLKLPNAITKGNGDESKPLDICLEVEFPVKPRKVYAEIKVEIAIEHVGASLKDPANGQLKFTINKKKETRICKKIELFLNGTGKYNKEISYDMKATHVPSKDDDFKPENVNLSVKSELSVNGLIWAQGCGIDTCMPKLEMITTYSKESPYIIGSSPSIDTRISVKNSRDVAYDACVHIKVIGADITNLPNKCSALAPNLLECSPGQPVYKGSNWDQDVSIDTTSLTNKNSNFSVTVTLFTECGNVSTFAPKTNQKIFKLNADAASVDVHRRIDEGIDDKVNLTRGDIAAQKKFLHVYKIYNRGPTNWVNVPITLFVPKLDIATITVNVNNKQCTSVPDKTIFHCLAKSIMSKDPETQVNVIFTVVPDKLNAKIGREEIIVQSKINVTLNDIEKSDQIKSELKLVEGVIPIWIIIVASILALIILVILFFILRECGFLKRKNKEELKKVRMSVRRQTMMRKSMMARPSSADQETLIREAEASHESDKKKKDRRVIINDF